MFEKLEVLNEADILSPFDIEKHLFFNNSFWENIMIVSIISGKKEIYKLEDITITGN